MTNIEKMYKLANIEATAIGCTNEDIQSPDYYSNDCEGDCIDCTWYDEDEEYPPFTESKQLELIKWLVTNWGSFTLYRIEEGFLCNCHSFSSCFCETEKQALAGLVCELWEDLNDTQREEVRGILE